MIPEERVLLGTRALKPTLARLAPLSRNPPRPFCRAFCVNRPLAPNTCENEDFGVNSDGRCRRPIRAHAASRWFESNELTHWLFLRTVLVPILATNKSLFGRNGGTAGGALADDQRTVRGQRSFQLSFISTLARHPDEIAASTVPQRNCLRPGIAETISPTASSPAFSRT
jgi:hypothetical protein